MVVGTASSVAPLGMKSFTLGPTVLVVQIVCEAGARPICSQSGYACNP